MDEDIQNKKLELFAAKDKETARDDSGGKETVEVLASGRHWIKRC